MMKKAKSAKTVSDSICRIHKSSKFTMLSNCFIRSTRLSSDTIFLLARIMSLPKKWNFTKSGLAAFCNVGITAMERMLRELQEWGYLTVHKLTPDQTDDGRYQYLYDFYEYSEQDDTVPKYDVVMETYTADNAVLYRTEKKTNYFVISNKLLWDQDAEMKPMGILLKALSLPDTWRFSLDGLIAICKEGKTAVKNAVNYLIGRGYLVRTQLLAHQTKSHHIEYIYEFFEKALTKEEAEQKSDKTREKACKAATEAKSEKQAVSKKKASHEVKKQGAENLSPDKQCVDGLPLANDGLYNNTTSKTENQKRSDQSSIIPSAAKRKVFNKAERMNDGYNAEEREAYTDLVRQNIGYYHLGEWLTVDNRDGYEEADAIVSYIVDEICSPLPNLTVKGQAIPRSVVKATMLRADINSVENTLVKMAEVDGIKDYRKYFIAALYNEILTYRFSDACDCRWAARAVARDFGYSA